jgi:hypothetical protein
MAVDTSRWPRSSMDGPDVVTALQEVGREGMAEGVATGALVEAGRADGADHGALHVCFVVVMPVVSLFHGGDGNARDPPPVEELHREGCRIKVYTPSLAAAPA